MNGGKEVAGLLFYPPMLNLHFYRQLLGNLEQRFNALEEGGKSMVEQVMHCSHYNQNNGFFSLSFNLYFFFVQAKRLATQQAAKGWFGF